MANEAAVSAAVAALVQGIQAYIMLARLSGVEEATINDILEEARKGFLSRPASALPDPK